MRINNNPQCPCPKPAFGMALKIKPEAMKSLNKASMEKLQTIKKLGEELANTQHVDLEIGKDLTPRINYRHCANAYVPPFAVKNPKEDLCPEFLELKTVWDGTDLGINLAKGKPYTCPINMGSKEAAVKAYEKVNAAPSTLEKAAELTKIIDNRLIEKASAEKIQRLDDARKADYANALFEKYGTKD